MSAPEVIFVAAVLFFGGFVKGSIGFGAPLVAAPLLALLLVPGRVVTLLTLSILLSNVTDVWRLRTEWRALGRVAPYLLCALAAIPAGVWFLEVGDPDLIRLMMGLMAYAYLIAERRLAFFRGLGAGLRGALGAAMGALLGFVYGATTISGAVNVIYFSMLRLPKNPFIFLMNAFNATGMSVIILTLSLRGFYAKPRLIEALLAVAPLYAGYWAGVRIRDRIDHALFFKLIRVALFFIATSLVARFVLTP